MKKTALILTFALAAAACSTDYTPDAERTPGMVRLSFRAMIPSTKTITGTGDMTLDHYQVFVFDSEGDLEANTNVINNTSQGLPTLELCPGKKYIWAVGNMVEDLSNSNVIDNVDDLKSICVALLDQPDGTGLFYTAKIENTQVTEDNTVDLEFDHMPCKVVIDKIERSFYDKTNN